LLIAAVYLSVIRNYFWEYAGGDSAVYLLLSESLISGQGYRNIFLPDSPPNTMYPPLFPAILTPVLAIGGRNFFAIHLYLTLISLLTLALVFAVFRSRTGERGAFLVAALTAMQSYYFLDRGEIFSDILYLAITLLCFLGLDRYTRSQKIWSPAPAVLALPVAAFLARTVGLSLLAATVSALLLDFSRPRGPRLKKALAAAVLLGIPVLAWFLRLWLYRASGAESYLDILSLDDYHSQGAGVAGPAEFLFRFRQGIVFYLAKLFRVLFYPAYLFPAGQNRLWLAFAGLAAALFLAGGWVRALRRPATRPLALYVIWYGLVILAWPYQKERFLLPLLPFIYYFFIESARGLGERLSRGSDRGGKAAAAAIMAVILALNLLNFILAVKNEIKDQYFPSPERREWMASGWVANNIKLHETAKKAAPAGSVILARKPQITYLLSGLKSVAILRDPAPERQWQYLAKYRVRYVLVDKWFQPMFKQYLLPTLTSRPETYRVIVSLPGPAFLIELDSAKFPVPPSR
jgi:hypothetical protein